jgi:hypothetical protein
LHLAGFYDFLFEKVEDIMVHFEKLPHEVPRRFRSGSLRGAKSAEHEQLANDIALTDAALVAATVVAGGNAVLEDSAPAPTTYRGPTSSNGFDRWGYPAPSPYDF